MAAEWQIRAFIRAYERAKMKEVEDMPLPIRRGKRGEVYDLCKQWVKYHELAAEKDRQGDWTGRSVALHRRNVTAEYIDKMYGQYNYNE